MKGSVTAIVIVSMVFFAAISALVFNLGGLAPEFLQPQSAGLLQYAFLLSAGFASGLVATIGLVKALKKKSRPGTRSDDVATTVSSEEPIA